MNRATIRKLYRNAVADVFGCGDKDIDAQLLKAIKEDVHLAGKGPGGYVSDIEDDGVLEIYCENGIPNASDINDFTAEAIEFGFDPSKAISYNSDTWSTIDDLVNLMLEAMGKKERYRHVPINSAVVGIYSCNYPRQRSTPGRRS
jgi:hypothetical protein